MKNLLNEEQLEELKQIDGNELFAIGMGYCDIRFATYHNDNKEKKVFYRTNPNGRINSREEIKLVIQECKRFLKKYNEKEINQFNKTQEEKENIKHTYVKDPTQKKEEKRKKKGYIYFLQDDSGKTKIGKTINLKSRMIWLSIEKEQILKLIHSIKSEDIDFHEKYIHKKYNKYREKGEWFNLPEEILLEIKDKSMNWFLRRS